MTLYYSIVFFIFGITLGSFYNVVGYRLPKEESLVYPSSHCTKCGHKLTPLELIPVFSFLFLRGKCHNCGDKISWFYPIFEFITGVLFVLAYLSFGFSYKLVIALIFISMLVIIVVSDYHYMIIPDEVLIVALILIGITTFIGGGIKLLGSCLLNGIISFGIMYLIKLLGDFIFKKESMGGGDIKLMFVIGFVLNYKLAIVSIFLGSIIGLPISLITYHKNKENIIPFGPYLSLGAVIILLSKIDFNFITNLFR